MNSAVTVALAFGFTALFIASIALDLQWNSRPPPSHRKCCFMNIATLDNRQHVFPEIDREQVTERAETARFSRQDVYELPGDFLPFRETVVDNLSHYSVSTGRTGVAV